MAADGSIVIEIDGDESKLEKKLGNISGGVLGGIKTAGKAAAAATAAVTGATVALATGVVNAAGDLASYGDNIDKMSQKMGMSATTYQEWDAVMQHCGTSIEAMQSSMKTLANAAETGNKAFDELGISQEEIASMTQEELFGATISALQNVESETQRTYLAGKLLGRGATELGALLNTSAEDTQAMKDRVHELGGVMSDDAVKAAATYQDSLQDMQTAFSGISRGLMSDFLPSVTGVMDGLTELFSGNSSEGLGMIKAGIGDFVASLTAIIPEVLDAGVEIVMGLAQAIMENLPQLVSCGTDALLLLVQGIIEQLPTLAQTAIQLVAELVTAIGEALPTLIPMAVEAITTLVLGLVENIPLLIDAALQLIKGLAQGLLAAIPVLLEALPEIITSLINAILEAIPMIIQTGIDLLTALVAALPDIITAIVEAIPAIITGIIDALLNNIPLIIQAGIDLLIALVQATPQIVVTIVKAIPQIITGIVNALINSIPQIIQAGVQLFMSLITNLPTIIVELVKSVPQIVMALVEGFTSMLSNFADVGKNIVEGVWNGIKNMGSWIKEKVTGFFGGIVDGVKGLLGIHSPSTVFADIGKFSMAGLAQGIDKNKAEAAKAAEEAVEAAGDAAEKALPALNPGFETSVKVNTAGLYAKMKGAVDAETASYSRNAINMAAEPVKNDNNAQGGRTVTHKVEVGFAPDGSKLARDLSPFIKRQTEIEGDSF